MRQLPAMFLIAIARMFVIFTRFRLGAAIARNFSNRCAAGSATAMRIRSRRFKPFISPWIVLHRLTEPRPCLLSRDRQERYGLVQHEFLHPEIGKLPNIKRILAAAVDGI